MTNPNPQLEALRNLRNANRVALSILNELTAGDAQKPDVILARTTELEALTKKELVAHILTLERPKVEKGVTVEDAVKAIVTNADCACLDYNTIAALIVASGIGDKTSSKSVASYMSKKGEEWGALKRIRNTINLGTAMSLLEQIEPEATAEVEAADEGTVVNG